jgi:signal transduction histidine kinase
LRQAEAQNIFVQSLLPTLGISVLALFLVVFRQVHAQVQTQKMLLKSEQELTAARDRALDASRLKSEFVANISHEIRTPLGGILGMAELLTLKSLESESLEISGHLFESAKHLLTVVNDLLDFSKLEAGKVQLESIEFSVRDIVNEGVRAVNAEATKKDLQLTKTISHAVPDKMIGDATRTKQVLINLLHNAIKFTKAGSVAVVVERDAESVKFSVTDTGIGVPANIQQNLFQPFVQADGSTTRVYGGTGLGLSISKSLVQLMNGEIGVDSAEGSGSTFWFSIPLQISRTQADERAKISPVG